MEPTLSFAPLAERLEAQAVKIRSELGGRPLLDQFFGVMVCILFYGWCRICHQRDARAAAEGQAGLPRMAPRDGAEGEAHFANPGARRSAPRVRLPVVASRVNAPPVVLSPGMPGAPELGRPAFRSEGGHGWLPKNKGFWAGSSRAYFVAIS